MHSQLRIGALATFLPLLLAGYAAAQPAQSNSPNVTFEVPLNITNLASDVTKVRLTCTIRNTGAPALDHERTGEAEFPVSGGQVVIAKARVGVTIPAVALNASSSGRTAAYSCSLSGYSPSLGWNNFGVNAQSASFRVAPQSGQSQVIGPQEVTLMGTFTW